MDSIVSVIIPTYNYANYIIEAINSVLQQDYPKDKIEIIVVDDGSTDNTKYVLQDLIQSNAIRYYYQQNEGKASATYKAIRQATGKYIFNLDADDYFLAGKLKRTVEVFEADSTVVHVGTPAKQLLPGGGINIESIPANMLNKAHDGYLLLKRFMKNNMLFGGGSTYAARASVLKKIVVPTAVDMFTDELLIIAILPYGNSYFIAEPLSVWRGHGSNYSLNASTKEMQIAKAERLLLSSDALLHYLTNNKFEKEITNIYKLKNLTNHISFKELTGTKTFYDIIMYCRQVFTIKPNAHLIKQYHVINRLIPTALFKFMKNIYKKNTNAGFQIV